MNTTTKQIIRIVTTIAVLVSMGPSQATPTETTPTKTLHTKTQPTTETTTTLDELKTITNQVARQYNVPVATWAKTTPCGTGYVQEYRTVIVGCAHSTDKRTYNAITISIGSDNPTAYKVTDLKEKVTILARHEAAHVLVAKKCNNNTTPPIAKGRTEPIADAYAHVFLGNPRKAHVSRADIQAAKQIHNGQCS